MYQGDAPRYLLGISTTEDPPDPSRSTHPHHGPGRVDACVLIRGDVFCAIEAKVGASELVYSQLARHAERWGVLDVADWRVSSWSAVHPWAVAERNATVPVTAFLLGQFLEFLRMTDLAPFLGFSDLELFDKPSSERDPHHRTRVRARLAGCCQAVRRSGRGRAREEAQPDPCAAH